VSDKPVITIDLTLDSEGVIIASIRNLPMSELEKMGQKGVDSLQKAALWTKFGALNLAEQADVLAHKLDG
jgi:hypothetical protein